MTLEKTPPSTLTAMEELVDSARSFAANTRSANTKKAYASDWSHFTTWAHAHGFESLPAEPAIVALYITALAATRKPSTITRRLAAISVVHQQAGHPTPTNHHDVRAISTGIRRTLGTAQREATPLSLGDLRAMLAHLPDNTIGVRDRAVLLTGFAGALRRSELVAINIEDLQPREEGLVLSVHRSKTDQEGAGRRVAIPYGHDRHTCPVRAIAAWRETSHVDDGPLFRSIDRHGNVANERLSAGAISLIVKTTARRARLDATLLSGHSLRAGFCTTAAAAGASERAIAQQTGHQSMDVLRGYIRLGSVFSDNAVTCLGL